MPYSPLIKGARESKDYDLDGVGAASVIEISIITKLVIFIIFNINLIFMLKIKYVDKVELSNF